MIDGTDRRGLGRWWGDFVGGRTDRTRYQLVDVLRGAAIVAMAAYHVGWDLFILRVIDTDITSDPVWVSAQRGILGSFLLLAGVGLVLGHGDGVRWRAFWRREAILVVAALLVTAGTYAAFPDYFAYFGVLHAITLFSVLALPLLRAPLWAVAGVAGVVLLAPLAFRSEVFLQRGLAWIGFWPELPPTVDLVAVFPWFGVMLGGVFCARLVLASPARKTVGGWRGGRIAGALAWMGRWSLVIYLLHQPILYGALSVIVPLLTPPAIVAPLTQAEEFAMECRPGCIEAGGRAGYCEAYCACALDEISRGNLWEAIGALEPTAADLQQTQSVIRLCRTMAER